MGKWGGEGGLGSDIGGLGGQSGRLGGAAFGRGVSGHRHWDGSRGLGLRG